MNEKVNDLDFLKDALDKELAALRFSDDAKHRLSQKMKKCKRRDNRPLRLLLVMTALTLAVSSLLTMQHREEIEEQVPATAGVITQVVKRETVVDETATVHSARLDEYGIWLNYDIGSIANEKVVLCNADEAGEISYASGMNETDNTEANIPGKLYQWAAFDGAPEVKKGHVPEKTVTGKVSVQYISGFVLEDETGGELGFWRGTSHSLLPGGVILSCYEPDSAEMLEKIQQMETQTVTLTFKGLTANRHVRTLGNEAAEMDGGTAEISVELERCDGCYEKTER